MFKNIKALLISMLTVFKHLFKRPVTLEYPEKKNIQPEQFRGKPIVEACIKCKTCLSVCPTGAISITDNEFKINLNKCIFCGNCAYYCPVKAIKMSAEYELATDSKPDLCLTYNINKEEQNVQ